MGEENASNPDPGFVPFRAARVLTGTAAGGERVPPPLPPPPPGVAPASTLPTGPDAPARAVPPGPQRPPLPTPGSSARDAWAALVGWCAQAGIADAGLLSDGTGAIVAACGELPASVPGELLDGLTDALAPARRSAGGGSSAAALDVGGRWLTAFAVAVPGRGDLVAVLRGPGPLRSGVRAALAGWLREALSIP